MGGAAELDGASVPSSEKADHRQIPLEEKGLGQSENEQINLPQSISAFLHLSQGRIEELTSLLIVGHTTRDGDDMHMAGSRISEKRDPPRLTNQKI